jgi:hypothetical protein
MLSTVRMFCQNWRVQVKSENSLSEITVKSINVTHLDTLTPTPYNCFGYAGMAEWQTQRT